MFSCCGATQLHVDLLYTQRRCLKETLTKTRGHTALRPGADDAQRCVDKANYSYEYINRANTCVDHPKCRTKPLGARGSKLAITRLTRLPTTPHPNPRCNSAGGHGGWVILRIQSVSSRHGYRHNVLRQYGSHRRGVNPLQNEIDNGYKKQ